MRVDFSPTFNVDLLLNNYLSRYNTVSINANAMPAQVLSSISAVIVPHSAEISKPFWNTVATDNNKLQVSKQINRV